MVGASSRQCDARESRGGGWRRREPTPRGVKTLTFRVAKTDTGPELLKSNIKSESGCRAGTLASARSASASSWRVERTCSIGGRSAGEKATGPAAPCESSASRTKRTETFLYSCGGSVCSTPNDKGPPRMGCESARSCRLIQGFCSCARARASITGQDRSIAGQGQSKLARRRAGDPCSRAGAAGAPAGAPQRAGRFL